MKLLPHQLEAAEFLSGNPGVRGLFDDMGTGKTRSALEAARLVFAQPLQGRNRHGAVIIGPPISLPMWQREFEDHLGKTAQWVKTAKTPLDHNADAYVMSYEIARKRVAEFKALALPILICDEGHALHKASVDEWSPGRPKVSKRTEAIFGKGGLCEHVRYTWDLTGTPMTRWNDDLYPFLLRAANGRLKELIGGYTLERFQMRYCVTQKKKFSAHQKRAKTVSVGNRNTEELRDLIYGGDTPLAIRREVDLGLPPLTINHLDISVKMTPELKEALDALKKMKPQEVEERMGRKDDEHMATIRRLIGMGKVPAFVDIIQERLEAGNKPILIGAWHTDVIDQLADKLGLPILDGRTSPPKKAELEATFNAKEVDGIIGQIAAMGVSLNLQAGGSHIACIESDWSPEIMNQFYKRLHRWGQKHHVHVDTFWHDNKLERAVRRIAADKAREASKLNQQETDHG